MALVVRLLTRGFGLFYVPPLAVRYEVTFGSRAVAIGAVCVIAVAAVLGARPSVVAALRLVAAAAAAAAAGWSGRSVKELSGSVRWASVGWLPHSYEARLLATGTAGALVLLTLCAVVDRLGAQWEERADARSGPHASRLRSGA